MKSRIFSTVSITLLTLTPGACGTEQETASGFQKASSEECGGSAMPQQFMVKNRDGSMHVVRAESESAFINGYMKANASKIQYAEHDYTVSIPKHVQAQAQSANNGAVSIDNCGAVKVHADKLWSAGTYGGQVVVAVIDSGVDIYPQGLLQSGDRISLVYK